jgi:Domain of unknown function (DUF4878)
VRRPLAVLCLPLSALALSACASNAVSTAGFTGQQHAVAQTISNLQAHATDAEQKKICTEDLAAAAVKRLGGAKRCEAAIKSQLAEIDNFEVSVKSVHVHAATATAQVKSIHEGKSRLSSVSLVKEGGKWKVAAL